MKHQLVDKNAYIDIYKLDEKIKTKKRYESVNPVFVFDQAMRDKKSDANLDLRKDATTICGDP